MIGVDTTVYHGYVNCGAVGAMGSVHVAKDVSVSFRTVRKSHNKNT